jgi:hypothetical protein
MTDSDTPALNHQYVYIDPKSEKSCKEKEPSICSEYWRVQLSPKVGTEYTKSPVFWHQPVNKEDEFAKQFIRNQDQSHQLVFLLKGGLYELFDMTNPRSDTTPKGYAGPIWEATKITNFTGMISMADDNAAVQPRRRWVAYATPGAPAGTYNLAVYDGVTLPQPIPLQDIRFGAVVDPPGARSV